MPTPPDDLKKQLLRGAVADNVAAVAGRPPAPRVSPSPFAPPARRPRRRGGRWLALAPLVALAGVVPFLGRSPIPEVEAATTSPPPTPSPAEPERVIDFADLTFPAPVPLDSAVLPLEVRRFVLDPGHGGDDLGTSAGEVVEKDVTLDIALRLRRLLERDGFEVALTRQEDVAISLRDRAQLANRERADVFVSIHINWMTTREVRGIETYYLGPTDDPALKDLARLENQDSGYTLSDMRSLLDRIYVDLRQSESRQLASSVQRSLLHSLREVNPGLRDRGVKSAPFVVLVATEMPAILAEVSCLSNREEAELLARPLYRDHLAEALHRGLRGFARQVHQIEEKGNGA